MKDQKERPECFGKLEIVFPKGSDDLRHTPKACMACEWKTLCLRSALSEKNGIVVKEEMLDRAYDSGLVGFWKRWSGKKKLQNEKRKKS